VNLATAIDGIDVTIESELLEFSQQLRWNEIPRDVREAVIALSADAIANAISGCGAADSLAVRAASVELYGPGQSTVIAGERTSLVGAVGINAYQVTAQTMCDVYRPGLCHVTPEVIPAALGVAELRDSDGVGLLTAIAAGLEATVRLCNAFNYPAFRARGWHSPGIAGALGASVATGLLSGLDATALAGCFGLAGAQAGGTFASMGTMAVKFHQLRGAQAAVIAALHAERGLLGSAAILSASDGGLLRAFSDHPEPDLLTDGLGEKWNLLDISMRPYPAASTLQSLINVLIDAKIEVANVTNVSIELPSDAYLMGGEAGWENELRAMQSARYVASGVLVTRSCWTDLFDEEHRNDLEITDLASQRVHVRCNSALPDGGVRVTIETSSGDQTFSSDVARGDPRSALSQVQLLEKFRRCVAGSSLEGRHFDVQRLLRLEDEPSIASLMRELAAA
jgi:2-methylcitrate dehydratase PrpD